MKKNVNETGKTTQYIGGFVYENDVLQFMGHEEGRIRYNTATSSWVYDYFIKDNLGNVRMVLTEQEQSDQYPALSFEGTSGSQQVNDQNAFWEKSDGQPISVSAARVSRPGAFGTQGTNGDYAQLLRKSTGSIGATKLMKVMAGDKIHVKVDYYHNISSVNNSGADGLSSMISSLFSAISSPSSSTSALFKGNASSITTGLNSHTDVTSFFAPEYGSGGTAPKAYLHVLLFDERFKFDQANSFVQQVSSSTGTNTINKFAGNAVEVKKSGYAFVYISNEGDQLVYFDNLLLTHERGRILEESHYYPFGLTQAGLGSKALSFGGANNKFKYNGKEEQRQEFSDGTGLDWLDYGARMYDAQVGRWHVVDPLADDYYSHSTYNYVLNNPLLIIDPDGRGVTSTHTDSLGNVLAVFNDNDNGVYKHSGNATAASVEKAHTDDNTSAGGTLMGETQYWDEFANHDANGNIIGNKNGNFGDQSARIFYGVSADDYMQAMIAYAKSKINSFSWASQAKAWLQTNSKRHGSLDIKDKLGANRGYLLNGKYVSGETAGNYLFGANLESLRLFADLDNIRYPFTNKESVFYRAAKAFGAYHNSSNNVNNPSVKPYYGEIAYSGRTIVLGYYGSNSNNPIFNDYPSTAIYGNLKVK